MTDQKRQERHERWAQGWHPAATDTTWRHATLAFLALAVTIAIVVHVAH